MGEEIYQEILAQIIGSGVESPSAVDLGHLLDKLQERSILPEHEDVQVDPARSAFLELQKGPGQSFGVRRELEEDPAAFQMGGGLTI